jgi:hypothetical protein
MAATRNPAKKKIFILSLGEILTPDISKAITALAKLIAEKNSGKYAEVLKKVESLIQTNNQLIQNLKLGQLDEKEFDKLFIDAIKVETDAELTVDEFNQAWNKMIPEVKDAYPMIEQLQKAVADKHNIILVSETNPKDLRVLTERFGRWISFSDDKTRVEKIFLVPLYLSHILKLSKPDLVKKAMADLLPANQQTLFANSVELDVCYIYSATRENLPAVEAKLAGSQASDVAEASKITAILWNKSWERLEDLMSSKKTKTYTLDIARASL